MSAVRLSFADQVRTALIGPRSRPLRTVLSALGVAVGIAALTAISGIAATNRAQLLAELDGLGANLLVVSPGYGPDNQLVPLPETAPGMLERLDDVEEVGVLGKLPDDVHVYRTDLVPPGQTNGLTVYSADPGLLSAIEGSIAAGEWFDEATRGLPVTVLGSGAASRLGVSEVGVRVWIGGAWYSVVGILDSAGLAEQIDSAAFLGDRWANEHVVPADETDRIDSLYVRSAPDAASSVRDVAGRAANPLSPYVQVSKLSDLAGAREATSDSLSGLAVGLAAIALFVGGIGIANTMVVAVLERRGEIGLRRALGARSGQIAAQFVGEAITIAGIGGVAGAAAGAAVVAVPALLGGHSPVIPVEVVVGGPVIALLVGIVAGLYPAVSASRLSPTIALRAA
ncbi:putative ABC transport system permease protein [Microbacteriaceae bacterium SG_E_30_P1]|uniref:ABC transport system permease protein n=1 Tax=Antiquaquibacter oligotrophicus TaxID=2880260 RepID=A0ABT6KQI0_9MICO|nr:ABC transporter permease [Antiquaquibacter oligotrophicus]MDH6182235.1 putative ABC transport system permease protein [Antiquaquibacter oligotrophicus]UDF12105.1 ABC transporter permease [Antiquaquibacter oligotrophicus]